MNPLSALIAPVLAVLPAMLGGSADGDAARLTPVGVESEPAGDDQPAWRAFEDAARALRDAEAARQVRIEQRVIIRVAPGAVRGPSFDPRRPSLFSPFPAMTRAPRTIERKTAQCLPVSAIAGVQPDGSRLLLFLRDQRVLSATLEKHCSARDYYSGFLVERTSDGMVCAGRDKLLARSGANCGVGKLSQIVVLGDDDDE